MRLHPMTADAEARAWVAFLNHLLEVDADWVSRIVAVRLHCNSGLAQHPTVQAGRAPPAGSGSDFSRYASPDDDPDLDDDGSVVYEAGFLGLLNGYLGIDEQTGFGPIYAEVVTKNPGSDQYVGQVLSFGITRQWEDKQERERSGA